MKRNTISRRGGFTLIELLVVIAIMALLAAITAAAVGRVRASQQARNTEDTLNKLQIALGQQWKMIVDQCKQDRLGTSTNSMSKANFQAVLGYCNNDMDRAEALWAYMNLKREFPQTFAEATSQINCGNVTLQPRRTFASVSGSSTDEAAVLLYLNLSEKANGGMNFAADDVTAGAQGNLGNFRVFTDAWGTPIRFVRFFGSNVTEIQQPPFVNNKSASKDALDPLGKLAGSWPNQGAAQTALGVTFSGKNQLITVISAGPNKGFEMDPTGTTDDLYGYRLHRLGKRSD